MANDSGRQNVLRAIDSLGNKSFNSVSLAEMTGLSANHTSSVLTELRKKHGAIRAIDRNYPVTYVQVKNRVRNFIKNDQPVIELEFEEPVNTAPNSMHSLLALFTTTELLDELKRRVAK